MCSRESLTGTALSVLPDLIHQQLDQDSATYSVKDQIVNTFGIVGHSVSDATTQLCCYNVKIVKAHAHVDMAVFQ